MLLQPVASDVRQSKFEKTASALACEPKFHGLWVWHIQVNNCQGVCNVSQLEAQG